MHKFFIHFSSFLHQNMSALSLIIHLLSLFYSIFFTDGLRLCLFLLDEQEVLLLRFIQSDLMGEKMIKICT